MQAMHRKEWGLGDMLLQSTNSCQSISNSMICGLDLLSRSSTPGLWLRQQQLPCVSISHAAYETMPYCAGQYLYSKLSGIGWLVVCGCIYLCVWPVVCFHACPAHVTPPRVAHQMAVFVALKDRKPVVWSRRWLVCGVCDAHSVSAHTAHVWCVARPAPGACLHYGQAQQT